MKKSALRFKGLVAALAITATCFLALPSAAEGRHHGNRGEGRHQKMMQKMQERLNLTDQQMTQVQQIFSAHHENIKRIRSEMKSTFTDEQRQAMKEMRKNHSGERPSREERQSKLASIGVSEGQLQQLSSLREQMKAERDQIKTEIAAVLTPEQQAQIDEMKRDFKGKRRHRGHRDRQDSQ